MGGGTSRKTVPKRPAKKKIEKKESGVTRLPALKPGKYADGLPLHEIHYLECKLILRPNHFTSRKSFFDFAKIMRRPAAVWMSGCRNLNTISGSPAGKPSAEGIRRRRMKA